MNSGPIQNIIFREAAIFDVPAIVKVHIESWQKSFAGIAPQKFLDSMSPTKREKEFKHQVGEGFYKIMVAESPTDGIIGFADFGEARDIKLNFEAELYAIYFLPDFQRKGVGGKLFKNCRQKIIEAGFDSMYLEALEISPYKGFYEKMGGEIVGKSVHRLGDEDFETVFYGWKNLRIDE